MNTKTTWKTPTLTTLGSIQELTQGGHGKIPGGSDAWIAHCPGEVPGS